jgi:AraC-like DNA-binding protein
MFSDFYHIGAVLSVFLGLVIIFRKNKTLQNYFLALWLIVLGVNVFLFHRLIDHQESKNLLGLINIILFTVQIPAPLFFVKSYSESKLYFLRRLIFFILLPAIGNSVLFFVEINSDSNGLIPIISMIYFLSAFPGFLIYSLLSLRKLKSISLQQVSDSENNDNTVIKRFLLGLLAAYLIFIIVYLTSFVFESATIYTAFGSAIVALSLSVIYAGLFGLQQSDIFTIHNYKNIVAEKLEPSESEIELLEKVVLDLKTCIVEKKPHLRPRLSLRELSEISAIPEVQISNAINTILNQNFYDYINSLRVEEFISKCKNKANHEYTLTAIAFECGFNSKSSFFEIFKKQTGQTPAQFIKSL